MVVSTLSLTRYETALSTWRSKYNQDLGQLRLLQAQKDEAETALEAVTRNRDLWQKVSLLLTKVSDYARRQLVVLVYL